MGRNIRLLQVEDSESDGLLIVRRLRKAGYEVDALRVETAAQMRAALAGGAWDVVIADYCLPTFSAPLALAVLKELDLDIPFLVVSGAMGEEVAVNMMKAGAHDYLLKDRLERLPPAVERELQDAALRRQHRESDRQLRALYSELETIYSNTPVLMLVVDENYRVVKMNDAAARYSGIALEACAGRRICELICCRKRAVTGTAPESGHCPECALGTAVEVTLCGGVHKELLEVWSVPPGVTLENPNCLLFSIGKMRSGERDAVLVCAQNVTELKATERSLEKTVDSLRNALAEKAVLFQEVHHRVKNNLQIIASLLAMKARSKKDKVSIEDLKDCQQRVLSMAMIHEQLYGQKDVNSIDFRAYIREMAPALLAAYERQGVIALSLDLKPVVLSIDQSIPCGLILNEIITNAVKYAYPTGKGEISIRLWTQDDLIIVEVADNGPGLPEGAGQAPSQTLGMQIIQLLTKQLHGVVEFSAPPGLRVTIEFPKAKNAA
jgi:two-component sensor histidine kinase/FixJ family two-component response regulator